MDPSSLRQFIQQFRGLLAIVLLCTVTISSFCALTLTQEKESISQLDTLLRLSLELLNITSPLDNSINHV